MEQTGPYESKPAWNDLAELLPGLCPTLDEICNMVMDNRREYETDTLHDSQE